jgi:hypothetical protein
MIHPFERLRTDLHVLKIELCDRSSFGNNLNALATETRNFTMLGSGYSRGFIRRQIQKAETCTLLVARQVFCVWWSKKTHFH